MNGFLGEIRYFSFGFPPGRWELCDGRLLSVQTYPALYAVIGTHYGGVAGQSFALPNLGGAATVGLDCANDPGAAGTRAGDSQYGYSDANVPSHSHAFRLATGAVADMIGYPDYHDSQLGGFYRNGGVIQAFADPASPLARMDQIIQNNPGQPGFAVYQVMQPYVTLSACMCVQGTVPTRS
jgi:microcystin-dependent protein